jgi:hypothetical protein
VSQATAIAIQLVVALLFAGSFWYHYGKAIAFFPTLLVVGFIAFILSTNGAKSSTRLWMIILGWLIIVLIILLLAAKLLLDNQKVEWIQKVYNFL